MQFSEIPGHQEIKTRLIQSKLNDRVAHAQLFLGETGYGTLALARAWAAYLNCEEPTETDSCGVCNSCRRIKKLEDPDVHFSFPVVNTTSAYTKDDSLTKYPSLEFLDVFKETLIELPFIDKDSWKEKISEEKEINFSARELRSISKRLTLKPFNNGYKIMIIWLPEFFGNEGNIILKTIEEPTPNTVLLFCSEDINNVLSTILSRVQTIRVMPISNESLSSYCKDVLNYGEEETNLKVPLAQGNIANIYRADSDLNIPIQDFFINWLRVVYSSSKIHYLNKITEEFNNSNKYERSLFFTFGLSLIRNAWLFKHGVLELSQIPPKFHDFIKNFSKLINDTIMQKLYELFESRQYLYQRNSNVKLLFYELSLQTMSIFINYKQ